MPAEPRITIPVLKVLRALLAVPGTQRYGLELAREAGLRSATIYAILARLEQAGWLESEWELSDPADLKRPRQRLYRLTNLGAEKACAAVENHVAEMLPATTVMRPLPRPTAGSA